MISKTMVTVSFVSLLLYQELFQDRRSDQERNAVPAVKIEDTLFRIYEIDLASASWSIAYYGDEYLASKYSEKHEVEIVYTGGNLAHRVEDIESLAWHKIPRLRSIELKSDVPLQLLAYISTLENLEALLIGQGIEKMEIDRYEIDAAGLASIGKLKKLEQLFLPNKEFTNKDLAFLKNLRSLKQFSFRFGMIDDSIMRDLMSLDGLEALRCGELVNLSSDTIEQLSQLSKLQSLEFSSKTQLDQILPVVAKLPVLKELRVNEVVATTLAAEVLIELGNLQQVETLALTGDLRELPSHIPRINSLKALHIYYSYDEEEPTEFNPYFVRRLPNLERLYLSTSRKRVVGKELIAAVSECPLLNTVFLTGAIDDKEIIESYFRENGISYR